MGMCLNGKGRMSVEVRRESFIIHPEYDGNEPHPEFDLKDLDDLIAALQEARCYVGSKGVSALGRKF